MATRARVRPAAARGLRVFAHDFWIVPATWEPPVGESFALTLRVGEHGRGDSRPRQPDRITRFWLRSPGDDLPVGGEAGSDPAGTACAASPGPHVIAYHGRPIPIEIPAAAFDAYLEEQGLVRIRDLRRTRGEAELPGREIYRRCAKCLVAVGGIGGPGWLRPVGLPLELVPQDVPGSGGDVGVRLDFEGRPLPGSLVLAMSLGTPQSALRAWTDDAGRARFPLAAPGPWLVTSVHMVAAAHSEIADWESFWASLTFCAGGH